MCDEDTLELREIEGIKRAYKHATELCLGMMFLITLPVIVVVAIVPSAWPFLFGIYFGILIMLIVLGTQGIGVGDY